MNLTSKRAQIVSLIILAGLAALLCLSFVSLGQAGSKALGQYIIVLDEPPIIEELARSEPEKPMRVKLVSLRAVEYDGYLAARQEQVRQALARVTHLRVQAQTRTVLNAIVAELDSSDIATVRALPGVRAVHRSKEYRLLLDAAIPLTRADQAWPLVGGLAQAGLGIKIGIIDSGIDISNPMFQDSSLTAPAGFPKGESGFANSKVIVARNYVSLLRNADVQTAEDRNGHGSLVAGAAAGNQANSPRGQISGVAPKAFLGNYKVFGTAGVNDSTNSGAIIAAMNAAVQDGMDILNLSVGGLADELPADDPEAQAIERAVQANVIVVVSAGNEGVAAGCTSTPCSASISSPATALSAITVGATTNSRTFRPSLGATAPTPVPTNVQQIGYQIGTGPDIRQTVGPFPITDTARLGDRLACNPLPAGSLSGRIALIERGACFFVDKVDNAAAAGAVAVIVFNSATQPNEYVIMAGLESTTIPSVFILRSDGLNLQNFVNSNPSTAQVQITTQVTTFATTPDVLARFSSRGPNLDLSVKPDLVAPGVDIYSAVQDNHQDSPLFSADGFRRSTGTSFSAPMVAGAAALVKQLHPSFTPAQVKSALVSRATSQVSESGQAAGIQSRGGGRLDVAAALGARATTSPVSISFGNVGSTGSLSRALTIQNFQNSPENYSILVETVTNPGGASVSVDRSALALPAGGSETINVLLQVDNVTPGIIQGQVRIQPAGGSDLFVSFWGAINNSATPAAITAADGDDQEGPAGSQLRNSLVVRVTDRNGVPLGGVTVAWSSQSGGTVDPSSSTTIGLGLAATRATLGPASGDQTFTATVGSLSVEFTARATTGTALTISGISPDQGPPAGGTTVTITGTNFQNGATVAFGTELAEVSSLTSTSISAASPANNPGTVDVSVTNASGQSAVRTSGFTYLAPASVQLRVTQSSLVFFATQGDTRLQEQSVGISNLSSGVANWTASSTLGGTPPRNWLSLAPASGSTPATLLVRADPQGLPAGQYIGQINIVADSFTSSVGVTLNVLATAPSLLLSQVGDGQLVEVGGQFRTSIVLVNPNATAASLTVLFRRDDGSPLPVQLRTGESGSTFRFSIPPQGTRFVETDGSTPSLVVGSAEIQSSVPVGGAAIFLQRVPNRLDFEAAVGLALPQPTVVLPVDNTPGFNTGVALVNGSDGSATMTLVFRDELGVVRGSASVPLVARGHISAAASSLISATQGRRGTLTVQASSGATVAAVSVRAQDSGALTTLPAIDSSSPVSNFTLPHIAEGQLANASVGTVLFDTTWIFLNPGLVTTTSTMSLRDDSGAPLSVTLTSGETASEFAVGLSARQARFLQTNSSATSLLLGQALVLGNLPIGGAAVFRQRVPGRPDFEAGVGFSVPGQHLVLPFDNTPGFASGLAVSSSGDVTVTVTFILRGESGNEITRFTTQLPARGHTSFILREVAPETAGLRGSLELTASAPVMTAIGIRAFDSGPLTTLPVTRLAP